MALDWVAKAPTMLLAQLLPTMRLAYSFEAFARSWAKDAPPMEPFNEMWKAYLPEMEVTKDAPYSPELVADFREAMKQRLVSNGLLAALGTSELRASGWAR